MLDKALLGAVERALERNEPREFLRHSLTSAGYSERDIEEAINLALFRKQQTSYAEQQPNKEIKQPANITIKASSNKKDIALIVTLGISLIIFLLFFIYIRYINSSCSELNLPTLRKEVLGLAVNCNQVFIIYLETLVAILTTFSLLVVITYLSFRKKN